MKALLLALAVLAAPGVLQGARPVVIGTNGSGPLSRAANVGWARVSVYWSEVERNPGQFDWGTADFIVDRARWNGQQVLYILSGAPAWACGCTNGAARPADIGLWKRYVAAVVDHMKGRVAAYEIWNEPDLSGNSTYGVGWDADLDAYPRYVDYLVEASRIIRTKDPAARVVGPSLSGGWNYRSLQILSQLESTEYPDGNASTFVDVVSVHANAHDDWTAADAAYRLWWQKLYPLQQYNPRNAKKPIWVSEFGWNSDRIGEAAQRDRIRDFLIAMTGADSRLAPFRITHAFIYALHIGCVDGGQGIYDCNVEPKAVVTDYLQTLEFPAVQPVGPPLSSEGAAGFHTLPPCRLFDTRNAAGSNGGPALGARTQREFPVALRCGLPATARAVALNVTATGASSHGFLVVFPGNYAPFTSTLNFRPGQTRANSAVVGLTPIGGVSVGAGQLSGSVHVIADVSGYFE
jgi:hypothetical protein